MKGYLYIENDWIGKIEFEVMDESMGAIWGDLIPTDSYEKYQSAIRQHFELKVFLTSKTFNIELR
nr:hypothetical protein [uncultured Pedobacter sp.]